MRRASIAMFDIEQVLPLQHEGGPSQSEIARTCGLGQSIVNGLLQRAARAAWDGPG